MTFCQAMASLQLQGAESRQQLYLVLQNAALQAHVHSIHSEMAFKHL